MGIGISRVGRVGRGYIGIAGVCEVTPVDVYKHDNLQIKVDLVWSNIDTSKSYYIHADAPDHGQSRNRIFKRDFPLNITTPSGSATITLNITDIVGTGITSRDHDLRLWIKEGNTDLWSTKVVCENVIKWHNQSRPSLQITRVHDMQIV